MNLQKQLRCVYLHAFFSTLRFTDAVWVALLAARGFSLAEIGLAEGVFHLTSLLCEVPSGMAADLLGRRRTLIFGGVLGVFSALAMASAPGLGLICTAMALKALATICFPARRSPDLRQPENGRAGERLYKSGRQCVDLHEIATALGSLAACWQGCCATPGTTWRTPCRRCSRHWRRPGWKNPSSPMSRPPGSGTPCGNCPPGCVCIFWTAPTACAAVRWRGG